MCLLLLWKSERRKNNCYLVFGDKTKCLFFKKRINIKGGWLLHRRLMLHSRNPQITGGLKSKRVNCWLLNYNKFSRKALKLKNEGRYLIIGFKSDFC